MVQEGRGHAAIDVWAIGEAALWSVSLFCGAAKTSFMKKCETDSCKAQSDDKKLHGAAATSFINKCVKDAMTM